MVLPCKFSEFVMIMEVNYRKKAIVVINVDRMTLI